MLHVESGRLVPKTCKSWICPTCNVFLRAGVKRFVDAGARRCPEGFSLGFWTFTQPPVAKLDVPAFASLTAATVKRLRRRGLMTGYCSVAEFQTRGALHLHLLTWTPDELVSVLRPWNEKRRDKRQYGWHFGELVPLARDLGWGPMVDAAAADLRGIADYSSKSLAGYATKGAHHQFKEAGAKRIRPVNHSTSPEWAPGGMRAYLRGDLASTGTFVPIEVAGPCSGR